MQHTPIAVSTVSLVVVGWRCHHTPVDLRTLRQACTLGPECHQSRHIGCLVGLQALHAGQQLACRRLHPLHCLPVCRAWHTSGIDWPHQAAQPMPPCHAVPGCQMPAALTAWLHKLPAWPSLNEPSPPCTHLPDLYACIAAGCTYGVFKHGYLAAGDTLRYSTAMMSKDPRRLSAQGVTFEKRWHAWAPRDAASALNTSCEGLLAPAASASEGALDRTPLSSSCRRPCRKGD